MTQAESGYWSFSCRAYSSKYFTASFVSDRVSNTLCTFLEVTHHLYHRVSVLKELDSCPKLCFFYTLSLNRLKASLSYLEAGTIVMLNQRGVYLPSPLRSCGHLCLFPLAFLLANAEYTQSNSSQAMQTEWKQSNDGSPRRNSTISRTSYGTTLKQRTLALTSLFASNTRARPRTCIAALPPDSVSWYSHHLSLPRY